MFIFIGNTFRQSEEVILLKFEKINKVNTKFSIYLQRNGKYSPLILIVFKYINKFQNAGSFEGWIRKIMINAALQRYKSKSSLYPVIQIDDMQPEIANDTDSYSSLNVKELMKIIQTLPTAYRMVFNLYAIEGFKHREIAELLGISEGTSKSNLSDARLFLQKVLTAKKKIMVS